MSTILQSLTISRALSGGETLTANEVAEVTYTLTSESLPVIAGNAGGQNSAFNILQQQGNPLTIVKKIGPGQAVPSSISISRTDRTFTVNSGVIGYLTGTFTHTVLYGNPSGYALKNP